MAGFVVSYDPSAMDPGAIARVFGSAADFQTIDLEGCSVWYTPERAVGMTAFAVRKAAGFLCGYGDRLTGAPPAPAGEGAEAARAWCDRAFLRAGGLFCTESTVTFWTDGMAMCPLFWARLPSGAPVFASEAKLLLPFVGEGFAQLRSFAGRPLPEAAATLFSGIHSVPPGSAWTLRRQTGWELVEEGPRSFALPEPTRTDLDAATDAVALALESAVERSVAGLRKVSITLSGGVDSSSVAAIARRHVEEVFSYTVGTPYGDEFEAAREVAEHLGARHRELMMTADDLRDLLPRMIWLMETWDALTLQIAAPVAFLYQALAEQTPAVFLTGYGADLIFAGVVADPTLEEAALERSILDQVRLTVPTNELSPALASRCGITVRYPYWSREVLGTGLSLRGRLKLREGQVKYVLRRAAERFLPHEVAWRPKLGIHEGSAMHRLFTEVLGRGDLQGQGGRLREMAEEIFAAGSALQWEANPTWRKESCAYS